MNIFPKTETTLRLEEACGASRDRSSSGSPMPDYARILELLRDSQQQVREANQHSEHHRRRADQFEKDHAWTNIQFIEQREFLSKFQEELREILARVASTEPAVRELKEKLGEIQRTTFECARLETEAVSQNPHFVSSLQQTFPELSRAELRICTLLRLSLKSREIARLTSLSERSVEDHRLNIRKKLRLKRDENVAEYLGKV